jgi:secondary thiamine-phosphate synthase enzyme
MFFLQSFSIEAETTAGTDVLDLTPQVAAKVRDAGVSAGLLTLFISGSTAALTTIEYESGAVQDLKAAIERLFPPDLGYAHVRAAFLKPSLSIPIDQGRLQLGTWQQIVLLDFDNRSRQRLIRGQVLGLPAAAG